MQSRVAGVSGADRTATTEAGGQAFLSPEWIDEVIAALRRTARTDPYFKNVLSRFTLGVVYVVRGLPAALRECYDGGQAVIFARVDKGQVTAVKLGAELPAERYHLLVKSDYRLAQQIVQGKASPVSSFLRRRLTVEAVDFHQWPKYVPKATIAANLIVKLAKRVPATFAR